MYCNCRSIFNYKYRYNDNIYTSNCTVSYYRYSREQVSRLKKSGISDQGRKDILSDVPSEKISEVADDILLEGYDSVLVNIDKAANIITHMLDANGKVVK